jgi:2-(1,2-epoxy-1,2-dihydrophenyl)acetyl-CoA isomerase
MSEEKSALFEVEDGVAWLTFNRPDRLNALNVEMVGTLQRHLDQAMTDAEIKVLVITGAGRGFCSGADLKQLFGDGGAGVRPSQGVPQHSGVQRFTAGLLYLDKPVIAAINGPAVGAGFEISLACDLRIMAESAYFMEAAMRHGLIPGDGSVLLLPRIVGMGRAMNILLNGEKIHSKEAFKLGLATKVVPDEELKNEVHTMAKALASIPSDATAMLKQSVRFSAGGPEIGSVFSFLRLGVSHGKALRKSEGAL